MFLQQPLERMLQLLEGLMLILLMKLLDLLEYKMNISGSGITAVGNAGADTIVITLAPGSTLVPTIRG